MANPAHAAPPGLRSFPVPMPVPVAPRQYRRKAPHWLVSVDLGKHKVGWALWWVADVPVLIAANTTVAEGGPEDVALAFVAAVELAAPDLDDGPVAWVAEWPVKYPTQRKFHADIDALHAVGDAIAAHPRVGRWTVKFRPGEWKGNVPKAAHHARLRAALGTLDIPPAEHDTWDAIGIGVVALGLTRRGGGR